MSLPSKTKSAFLTPLSLFSPSLFHSSWPRSRSALHPSRLLPRSRTPRMQFGAGPETGAPLVPPPPVPNDNLDPSMGTETAVNAVTLDDENSTWQDNILSSRLPLLEDHPLTKLRAIADSEISSLPLPNRKIESWRFTDLRSVYQSRYLSSAQVDSDDLEGFDLRQYAPDTAGLVLVYVNGVFNEKLSLLNDDSGKEWLEAGGYFGSISHYKGDIQRIYDMLQQRELGPAEGGLFPTIGNAIASDALVLDIPPSYAVSRPVAVVYLSIGGYAPETASASATRLIVLAGAGSRLSLLETHASLSEETGFSMTLAGSAFLVERDASVSNYTLNALSNDAHLLSNVHAVVEDDANFEMRPVGVGSKVGRFSIGIDIEGKGANVLLHGALVTSDRQIADIHSRICHNALSATSNQLQKNISSDRGRAIFNGKIVVTPNGDGTDSEQLCRSLLLSNYAAVDAMPVLEIATDDVKCTHGATVSDLEPDELFYCQSRGLSLLQAKTLLVVGFALEVLGDCPFPTVLEHVTKKTQDVSESTLKKDLPKNGYRSN